MKRLSESKTRLSDTLSMEHRQRLVLTMLEDVLGALNRSSLVDQVMVLTRDKRVADHAATLGAAAIEDQFDRGINESIDTATKLELKERGGAPLLILPVDVPLVKSDTIDAIIGRMEGPHSALVVITPSRDGGTNALLRNPPDVIPTRFGPGSFEAHTLEARRKGVRVEIHQAEDLEIDLDNPPDLYEILAKGDSTRTSDYLESILRMRLNHGRVPLSGEH